MTYENLTRKRGGLKASLTNFIKFVESYQNISEALTNIQVIHLQERLSKIHDTYIHFMDIQGEIEGIVDIENLDEQYADRAKFEDIYYEYISIAKNMLPSDFDSVHSDQQSFHGSQKSEGNCITCSNKNPKGICVKLPDIPLPTFDGSFECWLEFHDTYESLINKNEDLSGIQKFHYLRASLKGKAADVIKSIEFSEMGYPVAWNALIARYNNKKLLIHNHLKTIFSLEGIHRATSFKIRGLIDELLKHLNSLKQLGQDTSNWDTLLIFMVSAKLDQKTVMDWERFSSDRVSPSFSDFTKFLQDRANILETIEHKSSNSKIKIENKHEKRDTRSFVASFACYFCNENHSIYSCDKFAVLTAQDRTRFIKNKKLCINCLRDNHSGKKCSKGPCKKCKKWHNTLLHQDNNLSESDDKQQDNASPGENKHSTVALGNDTYSGLNQGYVFLSTARIKLHDKQGKAHYARALLDSGSQSSFISLKMCERLGLKKDRVNLSVHGIGNVQSEITSKCQIEIFSLHDKFKTILNCFILPEITNISAPKNMNVNNLNIPANLKLADPDFYIPGPIDILIGAELFWNLLGNNRFSCGKNLPFMQETKLGWILAGMKGNETNISRTTSCNLNANSDMQKMLTKFWEIEEIGAVKILSKEEIQCEKIFVETTRRDSQGRFIVTLPLKQEAGSLGSSQDQAKKRFYSIERTLVKNKTLREYYVNFMEEYKILNHMSLVNDEHEVSSIEYFMPHHGVFRESSLTTKLRVVFDASAPSSNGLSLNNIQLIGPVLQDDLLSILLRFRKHRFVISADIAKMYRQVLVEPEQRSLQKIYWRSNPGEDLNAFVLNTVTYGQASASFLAIRCLFELANECDESNPEIADIIRHDFYVDDMLTGADSVEHAQYICREVSKVLKSGCFELRKWYSNKSEILECFRDSDVVADCGILEFAPDEKAKTLGLTWSCQKDVLVYNVEQFSHYQKYTKRAVLSLTAKIFDPLGLLSPCTIIAKIFMQRLWSEKLSWDEPLPRSLAIEWNQFCDDLPNLNKLEIERYVICKDPVQIELHGFADSSEKAYGACIYLRSINTNGTVNVNLLCAKSKVAPIKTITIPKLELCAALLLSRLARKTIDSLKLNLQKCIFWSDSTITLAWLKTSPNLLKIFVSNRVAEIQNLTEDCEWRHVPTLDNPADFVSRGLFPSQILKKVSWWQGPSWLKDNSAQWPLIQNKVDILPELKPLRAASLLTKMENNFQFERFSKFLRMQRVTGYMLRFKDNCSKTLSERVKGSLTVSELRFALKCLIKAAQTQSFSKELLLLRGECLCSSSNKISKLNPFVDEEGLLRVGGRLKHSDFPFDKKYPIILDSKHHFTKLFFEYEHNNLMHPGPQLLLSCIREKYWPISGRNLARSISKKCLQCFRFRPNNVNPIMGNLPSERLIPRSPFQVTGIDYAGPFLIRNGRGRALEKCYVGVFVCFATKALHLELISSLSSKSFIQALRRFASRRGKPAKIVSDNGTTFVGANRELGLFLKRNKEEIISIGVNEKIEWSFIPPYSPHFGGLWEAGVKSVKHHLRRVLANAQVTFEEFATILCQIESILNSRPLCPLSSDPDDLLPLTPAHFLIGKPLVAVPDEALEDVKVNRLTRFQLMQQICQHFWRRWERDYIAELQQRQKWRSSQGNLIEGALVLIKEDHTLPTEWKIGRIVKLHPGSDGVSRVASIKTSFGVVKRSFSKICPLPVDV